MILYNGCTMNHLSRLFQSIAIVVVVVIILTNNHIITPSIATSITSTPAFILTSKTTNTQSLSRIVVSQQQSMILIQQRRLSSSILLQHQLLGSCHQIHNIQHITTTRRRQANRNMDDMIQDYYNDSEDDLKNRNTESNNNINNNKYYDFDDRYDDTIMDRSSLPYQQFHTASRDRSNNRDSDDYYNDDDGDDDVPIIPQSQIPISLQQQSLRVGDDTTDGDNYDNDDYYYYNRNEEYDILLYDKAAKFNDNDVEYDDDYYNTMSNKKRVDDIDDDDYRSDDNEYYDFDPQQQQQQQQQQQRKQVPLPGNFWVNPIGTSEEIRQRQNRNRLPQQQPQQQPRGQATSSSSRRVTTRPTFKRDSIGNTQPQAPPPLLDLYNRLFWYGLEDNNDNNDTNDNNDNPQQRTMFGGTKGKFNGLSFLYDTLDKDESDDGTKERQQQRQRQQLPPSKRRRRLDYQYRNDDSVNTNTDLNEPTNNYIPVTPPYDPPRVPKSKNDNYYYETQTEGRIIDKNNEDVNQYMNQQDLGSFDNTNSQRPIYTQSVASNRQRDRRRNKNNNDFENRTKKRNNNDWVVNTVESWFTPSTNEDNKYNKNENGVITSSCRRRSKNDNDDIPIIQPISNALDTFFGLDRVSLQNQANDYNEQFGIKQRWSSSPSPSSTTTSSTITPQKATTNQKTLQPIEPLPIESGLHENLLRPPRRRNQGSDIEEERDVQNPNVPDNNSSFKSDAVSISDNDRMIREKQRLQEQTINEVVNTPSIETVRTASTDDGTSPHEYSNIRYSNDKNTNIKPLSWEERVMAIERVPPVGIPAWGPDGIIPSTDARTKAFQDAIMDIQAIQDQIQKYEQQVVSIQDTMAIKRIDIELLKRQLQKQRQKHQTERLSVQAKNLMEQIRQMEFELSDVSRRLGYIKLQKEKAVHEYNVLIHRRHWALFHCMKHVVHDETILSRPIDDALLELEENESAVHRHSDKRRNNL